MNGVPTGRLRSRGELRLTLVMNGWARRPRGVPTFDEAGVYPTLALDGPRRRARR
jgi:hypothetical protein